MLAGTGCGLLAHAARKLRAEGGAFDLAGAIEKSHLPALVAEPALDGTLVEVKSALRHHLFLGVGENEVPRPISEIFENVPFFRQTTSATFEVAWYYQLELLSDNPAASVKITDVAES